MVGTRPTRMETTCVSLLRELENVWTETGESEDEKDRMLLELEKECLQVYQKKVDEAHKSRAQIHQSLLGMEAELATLMASLGERGFQPQQGKKPISLRQQLSSITSLLQELRQRKYERIRQFSDILSQIEKISAELTGCDFQNDVCTSSTDIEYDLSIRKLNEYQEQLHALQREKSDRFHQVLEYVNEVHSFCAVLGMDFQKTVDDVHPGLHETGPNQSACISSITLDGLSQIILKLKAEKQSRSKELRETVDCLFKLWNMMDTPEEERASFQRVASFVRSTPELSYSDILSLETIQQTKDEVERLTKLKASRMKELVLKRRSELEDICRRVHVVPDANTTPEKACTLIDSGLIDTSELLSSIEAQIVRVNEESETRKEIMDKVNKWLAACEEESWLENYNQDVTKYSSGRGGHLNLKRAERARVTISKIPAIVDDLMSKTAAWEDERSMPFLYDGVGLVSILEEYKISRQHREEEKRRQRDQKKLEALLLTEREAMYGSKPSPKRRNTFNTRMNGHHSNGKSNGCMTPASRRASAGGVTPDILTPRSYSGHYNGHFNKEMRRLSIGPRPLNFVAIPKDDTVSFTSISGSEPGSPPRC